VSSAFLESCGRRLAEHVAAGRLHLASIAENDPRSIQEACRARGWTGQVDALYCIDAFVHLPFAPIASYMLAATEVLRPGGHLIFTFADGTSKAGQDKLLAELDHTVSTSCDPHIACFHWTSPELVRSFAQRIGFEVRLCEVDPLHGRDGQLAAVLRDPQAAAAARALRRAP
jgi:cyclopropane fatty-acyl-phospholipid synthase-like methyltransferase